MKGFLRLSDYLEEEEPKLNLADALTDDAINTEGLYPGQTPLRDTGLSEGGRKTSRFKDTVQGMKIDWNAWKNAPDDRKNFYYVSPEDVPKVIKKQYQNYFKNPKGYGLTDDSTLEDVIKTFDRENPKHKFDKMKGRGIDLKMKIKDIRDKFDLSALNPFHTSEASASEIPQQGMRLSDYLAEETGNFDQAYSEYSQKYGLDPNPDDPRHFYDYRQLFEDEGQISPDESGHLPSKYKKEGHPRMVVDGVNTQTGEPSGPMRLSEYLSEPLEKNQQVTNEIQAKLQEKPDFFQNIGESFVRGDANFNMDVYAFGALTGDLDYEKDVKPFRDKMRAEMAKDPIEANNIFDKALYSVSAMLPPIGRGMIQGAGYGAGAGLLASTAGPGSPVTVPTAVAAGSLYGSYELWYKQGAGQFYSEMREIEVDHDTAKTAAVIGGALYAAIEFSQVTKLIPGGSKVAKKLIKDSVLNTVKAFAKKHGTTWGTEVLEEGLQGMVESATIDIADKIANETDQKTGDIAMEAAAQGLTSMKESALPMGILLGPKAGVEAINIKIQKKADLKEYQRLQDQAQKGKIAVEEIEGEPVTEEMLSEEQKEQLEKGEIIQIEPKQEVKAIEVPSFKNSEEAIDYGIANKDNPEVIEGLKRLYDESKAKSKKVMDLEDPTDEQLQSGMDEAVRGQLFREAFQSAEKKIEKLTPEKILQEPKNLEKKIENIKAMLTTEQNQLVDDGEGGKTRLTGGFFAPFLQNKGYTVDKLNAIFDKASKGEKLTEKQKETYEAIIKDYDAAMNESRLVEKESDSELSELRKMFPEITDEEIQDIENQIENEELWDEETLSRAVEIYTEKKDVSKESASEVKPEEKGLTDKKKKVQDILKEKHPDLNFYVSESENEINLSKIIVPKESRNEGKGSKFTEDLIAYADSVGKRIVLTPSKDFGGSVTRLKKFYKSFGFKENKGKSRDFTTQESFIRDPLVQKAEEESGGEKVRSLSKGIEADAIEKGLVEDLGDLPTYAQRNMKEVAERSLGLINKDPELAKKIAFREVPEQDGYRAEELYTALRVKAIAEGDVDMIMRLSSDESASIGTEAGQRVKALDSKNENDPVRAIKEIEKERTEYSKKTPSHKKADKVSKLEIRVKELEERLNKTQKDLAEATTKRKAKKRTQFGSKNTIFTNEGLDEARESLKHKMSGLHAGLDPTVVVDLTQIGGFYFEGGVRSFAEWSAMIKEEFGDRINPYLKRVWREVNKKYNENKIQEIEKKLSIAIASEKEVSDVSYLAQELSEHLISGGIVDRKNLVTEVQKILKEYFPSISKRQTADAISGYGKYTELSDDKVKALLRDIKGQLQQVSKLEDMQSGKAPLKTGVERRAVSDEERRLIKLVEESKKKYNIQTTDPDKQLKSALESYKTRLKNQIKDLEKQIHDRKKIVKGKTPLKLDVEASNLIEKKNVLKKVFVQVFGRSGLSQEQRIRMAENALKKSIAEYERRIRERDISPKEKGTPVSTRSLNALRSKRDSLKHQYENFKKSVIPKKSSQEIALQSLKTRLTNESKRLETRIEEMDFEETQKREILLDVQAKKLKEKRDQAKEAYNAAKYVKENLTKDEVGKIVELSKKASEAKAKVVESGDWTADNKDQVLEYFVSKQKFEDYVESLKPIDTKDVVNNAIDYFRASILASPRILRNSFLYQIIPGIERSITKRIVTGAFSDADLQSNIVEKLQAKLSGVTPTKKGMDFIKRQVAMAIEIYHKTGFDISRMDKLGKYPKFFGENVGKIRGDSVFARYARMVNLAPKWLAGGTDMLFANIGRADTVIMMSKEIAKVESMKGVLPEGMSEEERADQLLKDSYSFDPKDKRANDVRDAGIMDAHMMNNTQPGSWSDFVIDMRKRMKIGSIHFGKAIVPFAKIANVVVAEGVKTATGYGVAKSIYNINNASKQANQADRAKLMRRAVTDLVRYVGLSGATLIMTALLDDDDYVGAYDAISPKEYYLARSRGGGTNYIRIGGKWLSLRYLPMINIPISAVMAARQAKSRNDSPIAGYLKGMMGNVLEAPGIKETKTILQRVGWSVKADNMEKMAENLHLDWDGLSNWAKVRMIPSVLSYDVWNALFPKNSKYDFMGREIERGGVFRDDKSNEITLEFNRLANNGAFPVISDPSGAYAVSLEEKMGEEEYSKKLASYKKEYAEKVLKKIRTRRYKKETDKEKKKIIDSLRKEEVLEKLKKADRKIK